MSDETTIWNGDVLKPEDVLPLVKSIAKRLSFEWPGIEADDIEQEVSLFFVTRWDDIVGRYEGAELDRIIRNLAQREGYAYCARERYAYQQDSAEWVYTPKEIRQLLRDHYFIEESWNDAPKRPEVGQTLLGDGVSIPLMDIKTAMEKLPETDQAILIRAYELNETLQKSEQRKAQRAVDRLTNFLNRGVIDTFNHEGHDGPGSREVMSNSQARYATDSQDD